MSIPDRKRTPLVALAAMLVAALASPALAVPPDLAAIAARIERFPQGRGAAAAGARLAELFDLYWSARMRVFPELATYVGYSGVDDRLSDLSPEGLAFAHRLPHLERAALDSIDRAPLTPAERTNADLLRRRLDLEIEGEKFGSLDPWTNDYLIVDSMTDRVSGALAVVADMPARTAGDYEHMLARLRAFPALADEGIARLKEGLARGITPPRVTLGRVAAGVLTQVADDPEKCPYLAPFRAMPDTIPAAQREAMRRESADLLRRRIDPALSRYADFLAREYVPHARESIAISALPRGSAWYAWLLRWYTTTDLAPDEIHRRGLAEVERIRREMDRAIAAAGFHGTFAEFAKFLRADPRFFYSDADALVSGYRDIAKRIDPELIRLFRRLPRLPYGVKPMEGPGGETAPSAFYSNGSLAAGTPGWLLVNTSSLASRPKWEMEALTLHEAVPGHHLAYSLAQELEGLPEWRKWDVYPAFSEGWALYAESLGTEIGLYRDPYSDFGRLNLEIWRAIRMVVDTGLQTMGWTRRQAIDYCRENSARSEHDIEQEVDRYIVQPGSAPAYKVGEMKIRELRQYAERTLGPRFDVRDFHDAILGDGQLPMDVLEARVRARVAELDAAARR